jgi:hypothetical protein
LKKKRKGLETRHAKSLNHHSLSKTSVHEYGNMGGYMATWEVTVMRVTHIKFLQNEQHGESFCSCPSATDMCLLSLNREERSSPNLMAPNGKETRD